ncbi:MAG: right-handed parallel beta-helix repeat-containing protein [Clostridiales bacterium]|nr:right-handed parallel beta-helix repeat-containing protein [Clostridiales bacterium]
MKRALAFTLAIVFVLSLLVACSGQGSQSSNDQSSSSDSADSESSTAPGSDSGGNAGGESGTAPGSGSGGSAGDESGTAPGSGSSGSTGGESSTAPDSGSDGNAGDESSAAPGVSDGSTGDESGTAPDSGSDGNAEQQTNADAPAMTGSDSVRTSSDPVNSLFVSPTGNDATATGAMDAPYRSINAALAVAQPGDTVILRGGTYREGENVRIRIPDITIRSAEGEWAVIDLTVHNPGCEEDSGVYFDVDSSGGRLQRVEVMGGYYAVCMETKWGWHGDDDWVAASNIVIEDCVLHDSQYDVVKVKPNCNNITIRRNEIYNSGRALVNQPYWLDGEANAEGIDNVNGDFMVVQGNYIHDIGGNGVYAKGGATDALIENNRIERIYGAGIMVGFDTSPEWFDLAANPRYYENIRAVVRHNLILGTGWEGIGFYGSQDAQVYNNTLIDVDNGRSQVHSAIYFGLTYQDWEAYAGRPASVNPAIHHNIVCQPASFNRRMIEIRYSNDLGGMSALEGNPRMSDNCYFVTGKSAAFADSRPGSVLEDAGLSAWQAHIGGDSGSLEADPLLGADYLPANPQCVGMGWKGR